MIFTPKSRNGIFFSFSKFGSAANSAILQKCEKISKTTIFVKKKITHRLCVFRCQLQNLCGEYARQMFLMPPPVQWFKMLQFCNTKINQKNKRSNTVNQAVKVDEYGQWFWWFYFVILFYWYLITFHILFFYLIINNQKQLSEQLSGISSYSKYFLTIPDIFFHQEKSIYYFNSYYF